MNKRIVLTVMGGDTHACVFKVADEGVLKLKACGRIATHEVEQNGKVVAYLCPEHASWWRGCTNEGTE